MKAWLNESAALLRANFGAFYVFALLAEAITGLILEGSGMGPAMRGDLQGVGGSARPPGPVAVVEAAPGGLLGGLSILMITTVVPLAFASATIGYASLRYLDGNPATVGECLGTARARASSLLIAGVIAWIGVYAGLMLFFVPGLIVFAVLFLTWPVIVAEGIGPIDALRRSRDLTRGIRFAILGVFFLVVLAMLVAGEVVAGLLAVLAGALGFEGGGPGMFGTGTLATVAMMALQAVFVAYGATLAAVIYRARAAGSAGRTSASG